MAKIYYEIILEGHYNFVYGMLEGYKLAVGKNFEYYLCKKVNIKNTSIPEIVKEWLTLKTKIQHIVIESSSWKKFESSVKKQPEGSKIHKKYIKSVKRIKKAKFDFNFEAYAIKYANEIKELLKKIPKSVKLIDYNPVEEKHEDTDAKETGMYAPEHTYVFKGEGTLIGNLEEIIKLNKIFDEHPLIEVSPITLEF